MTRSRRHFVTPLALTFIGMALAGCVTTVPDAATGRYAAPIGGSPVISNETPYSRALTCIAGYNSGAGRPVPRVAVGQIADYTGKEEADGSGRKITQGAALMAISALNKAGVRLVERFDTSVAELELKYANNKLIGGEESHDPYRKILAGSIPGSDYYLVGGITEMNFNIRSEGAEADTSGLSATSVKANATAQVYVMNVGLDLRLVDTKTLEVVDVISYQKQIVGRQIQAGVFDILGHSIVNIGAGNSALEPIQLAVRAVIERAVLEMVTRLYGVGPETCSGGPGSDPLADSTSQDGHVAPRRAVLQTAAPLPPAAKSDPVPALISNPAPGAPAAGPKTLTQPVQTALATLSNPVTAPHSITATASKEPATSQETNHAQSDQNSYRWYGSDAHGDTGLRGGVQ